MKNVQKTQLGVTVGNYAIDFNHSKHSVEKTFIKISNSSTKQNFRKIDDEYS